MDLSNQKRPDSINAELKLHQDDLRPLQDHELDRVSGGHGPTIFKPPGPRGGRPG
jgi:hypothetical protein